MVDEGAQRLQLPACPLQGLDQLLGERAHLKLGSGTPQLGDRAPPRLSEGARIDSQAGQVVDVAGVGGLTQPRDGHAMAGQQLGGRAPRDCQGGEQVVRGDLLGTGQQCLAPGGHDDAHVAAGAHEEPLDAIHRFS